MMMVVMGWWWFYRRSESLAHLPVLFSLVHNNIVRVCLDDDHDDRMVVVLEEFGVPGLSSCFVFSGTP